MRLSSLIFLASLISGSLIGTTGVHAAIITVGPQSPILTNIAKGTLFAKPNGSGTTCTVAAPCNIWTAAGKATSGDVVFLRGGTYPVTGNLVLNNTGTAAAPVVYESYPGELAIFDGSLHERGTHIRISVTGKFIHLRNIEVKNMPMQGIDILGTDNVIDGVHAHHNGLTGISIYSSESAVTDESKGSRNIIRNCITNNNSDVGSATAPYNNGNNADGISINSGADNRIENNLVYMNSDDGIDVWRGIRTYMGYNIVHSNGFGGGDGSGIKGGGNTPSTGGLIEHNLVYSNKTIGLDSNGGANVTFSNNTTWNNGVSRRFVTSTIANDNISTETTVWGVHGIETNNSWQRSGTVEFISTDPKSPSFLIPKAGSSFDDIGALQPVTSKPVTSTSASVIGPQPLILTDIDRGTLFVKPNGSGTACSKAIPCDIWTAIGKASGGDVVFLRGGTYAVSKDIIFDNTASETDPVVYESYPGESVVFDGSKHPMGTGIYIRVTGKFITLRGIEVKNMPQYGIWISGVDNVLDGVHSHHNGLSGIQIYSPYDDFPYGEYGSRNTISNCIVHDNISADGRQSDGIAIPSGADNRVKNCLVYNNSDDGIDMWRSTGSYVGYSIFYANGIANGDGDGIKAGGSYPNTDAIVEHNLSYSNRAIGINYNSGANVTLSNNTTWNNKVYGYKAGSDTILNRNISSDASKKYGNGIEIDNSWQRSGSVAFISTDSRSTNFLVPVSSSGFTDIGAFTNVSTTTDTTSLPDVIVTQLSYTNGIFTSTVTNRGTAATPAGIVIGVGYSVNGNFRTWGSVAGPLAAGASVTIGTKGGPYVIPNGTHTIMADVDDVDRFVESNETNNQLTKSVTVP